MIIILIFVTASLLSLCFDCAIIGANEDRHFKVNFNLLSLTNDRFVQLTCVTFIGPAKRVVHIY